MRSASSSTLALVAWISVIRLAEAAPAPPKVLVHIVEDRESGTASRAPAEAAIARTLADQGLILLTPAKAPPWPDGGRGLERAADLRAIAKAAAEAGADVVVAGMLRIEARDEVKSLATGQTASSTATPGTPATPAIQIDLKAVRADDGELMWSEREAGPSLIRTATTASARLAKEVLDQWTLPTQERALTVVLIGGGGKLAAEEVVAFKEMMFISVDGVEEIVQRSFNDSTAELRILFNGDRKSLPRAIDGRKVRNRAAKVKKAEGNRFEVSIE